MLQQLLPPALLESVQCGRPGDLTREQAVCAVGTALLGADPGHTGGNFSFLLQESTLVLVMPSRTCQGISLCAMSKFCGWCAGQSRLGRAVLGGRWQI